MTQLHRDSKEANKHTPKGFDNGATASIAVKGEQDTSVYDKRNVLTQVINFVDGSLAPPSVVLGDAFVLIDNGGGAIDAGWSGSSYNDWVRSDGGIFWNITPVLGMLCNNQSGDWFKYDGVSWVAFGAAVSIPDTDSLPEGAVNLYNQTHIGDATGATSLTLQPAAITGKAAAAALTGTETVLLEQSGVLVKSTAQDIADLGGGDSLYTADGTLTSARVVTMGANPLSFEGNTTTFKGLGSLTGTTFSARNALNHESLKITDDGISTFKGTSNSSITYNIIAKNLSNAEVFKVSNAGLISTKGNPLLHRGSYSHTFTGLNANTDRGIAVFTAPDKSARLSIGTSGVGINRDSGLTALAISMKAAGNGFLLSDELASSVLHHQNNNGGNRFGIGRGLGSGTSTTDGILNIAPSRANAASIKLDSGVDPTGTNLTGGAIWYNGGFKFQTGTDTILLYAQDNTVAASALVGGGGTAITDADTFGGFTLQQLAQLLLNNGLAK